MPSDVDEEQEPEGGSDMDEPPPPWYSQGSRSIRKGSLFADEADFNKFEKTLYYEIRRGYGTKKIPHMRARVAALEWKVIEAKDAQDHLNNIKRDQGGKLTEEQNKQMVSWTRKKSDRNRALRKAHDYLDFMRRQRDEHQNKEWVESDDNSEGGNPVQTVVVNISSDEADGGDDTIDTSDASRAIEVEEVQSPPSGFRSTFKKVENPRKDAAEATVRKHSRTPVTTSKKKSTESGRDSSVPLVDLAKDLELSRDSGDEPDDGQPQTSGWSIGKKREDTGKVGEKGEKKEGEREKKKEKKKHRRSD